MYIIYVCMYECMYVYMKSYFLFIFYKNVILPDTLKLSKSDGIYFSHGVHGDVWKLFSQ